jgi:hypothetical protein
LFYIPNTRFAHGHLGKKRGKKLICQPDDPNVKEQWKNKNKTELFKKLDQ